MSVAVLRCAKDTLLIETADLLGVGYWSCDEFNVLTVDCSLGYVWLKECCDTCSVCTVGTSLYC